MDAIPVRLTPLQHFLYERVREVGEVSLGELRLMVRASPEALTDALEGLLDEGFITVLTLEDVMLFSVGDLLTVPPGFVLSSRVGHA